MLIQGSSCPTTWGNTGTSNCAFGLDQLVGAFITKRSKCYDMSAYANFAAFYAALQADAIAALPVDRLYPIHYIADVTSNTGEPSLLESANGMIADIGQSQIRWTINMKDFGLKTLANLSKYTKNKDIAFWPIYMGGDANDNIQTRIGLDGKNYGFDALVYTGQPSPNSGATKAFQQFMVAFEDKDAFLSDKIQFISTPAGYKLRSLVHGVHDLKLKVDSASETTITVAVTDAASGAIMGETYEAALEQVTSPNIAWALNLVSTGANVPISTVTWNNITKLFTLAGTFTKAAHKLSLVSPFALNALAVPFGNGITGGFESDIVDLTPA